MSTHVMGVLTSGEKASYTSVMDDTSELLRLQRRVKDLEDEGRMLREHINRGIERQCGYFCALPVCAKEQRDDETQEF